jgi:hypothetical protein
MMFYQNRQFVGMREVFDYVQDKGFREIVTDEPTAPQVFVPTGTTVYGEPVIRMGVMSAYSMQTAIHQWFTADGQVEVTEAEWLEGIPAVPLHVQTNSTSIIIFETEKSAYACILSFPQNTSEEAECSASYSMELSDITGKKTLLSDSVLVHGGAFATYTMMPSLADIPLQVTGQLMLDIFNKHSVVELYSWIVSDADQSGTVETLVKKCTPTQLVGYQNFLKESQPPNKSLLN